MNIRLSDRWYRNIVCGLYFFALFGFVVYSQKRCLVPDECESIHSGWYIAQGLRPYTDFFQHHNPLSYYLWAVLIKFLGECAYVVRVARFIILLFLIITMWSTYVITKKIFSREGAFLVVPLLSSFQIFVTNAIEIRPDVIQVACGLASFSLLFTFFECKKIKNLISSGFLLGCSFLALQKAVAFIFLFVPFLIWGWYFKKFSLYDGLIFLVSFSIPVGAYVCYLLCTGQFQIYWTYIFEFNKVWIGYRWYPKLFLASWRENNLIWLFYIVSLCCFLKTDTQKIFVYSIFAMFLFLFSLRCHGAQYFMACFPLMASCVAHVMYELFGKKKITLVIVLVGVVFLHLMRPMMVQWNPQLTKDCTRIDLGLKIVPPKEYVYCMAPSVFSLFRKDIHHIWFAVRKAAPFYEQRTGVTYDFKQLVLKYKPMLIASYPDMVERAPFACAYEKSRWKDYGFNAVFIKKIGL